MNIVSRLTHLSHPARLAVAAFIISFSSRHIEAAEKPIGPAEASVRVMSFNARYGTAKDGENDWDKRLGVFFATIRNFGPDLIGFQEVLTFQREEIERQMSDYAFYGVGPEDGVLKGQMSLIGYRKDRFSLLKSGNFWLSETPDVPSKSWDSAQLRICSWVRLHDKTANRDLLYANTHFDHRGEIARREASRVMLERLTPLAAGIPAFLTGDFNSREDSPAYQNLIKPAVSGMMKWIDAYRTVHAERKEDEASFHAFSGKVQGSRIDFVFSTPEYVATAATIDRSAKDGRYPSDHYPVSAVLVPVVPGNSAP